MAKPARAGRDLQKQILTQRLGGEHHAERHAVVGFGEREADRRLAGEIGDPG